MINKREFAEVLLNQNINTFIVHVAILEAAESAISMHFLRPLLLAVLQQEKALLEILKENGEYTDIFSSNLAMKLPKNTGINKYAFKLVEDKQSLYGPI